MLYTIELETSSALTSADCGKALWQTYDFNPRTRVELVTQAGGRAIGSLVRLRTAGATQIAVLALSGPVQLLAGAAIAAGALLSCDATSRYVTRSQGEFVLGRAVTAASGAGSVFTAELYETELPIFAIKQTSADLSANIGYALSSATGRWTIAGAGLPANILERVFSISGTQYGLAISNATTTISPQCKVFVNYAAVAGDPLIATVGGVFQRTGAGAAGRPFALEAAAAPNQLIIGRSIEGQG